MNRGEDQREERTREKEGETRETYLGEKNETGNVVKRVKGG